MFWCIGQELQDFSILAGKEPLSVLPGSLSEWCQVLRRDLKNLYFVVKMIRQTRWQVLTTQELEGVLGPDHETLVSQLGWSWAQRATGTHLSVYFCFFPDGEDNFFLVFKCHLLIISRSCLTEN